ncbi:translation initiation factor IF-2 [endosymbiont GvMRE of Glomus versiforme]|uniref:translation initiation factor IF-2 n=1 Tax=endosymbiont GvMRE of Glomus versiforme TaxID=2039283 RepID=UPI000EC767C0|nr:translation initiation factor IF-2 [endosymbiont GvMRE of Glomus versiforme]RHZ37192.1 Translation initiation factor IF-2 [endosymbiont GvMRE of Glomus versiforme]
MTQDNNQLLLELLENKLFAKNWQEIRDKIFFYAGNLKLTDLSQAFQVPAKQIITFFWDKGVIVNQEQNLSLPLIKSYCQSHGVKVIKQKNSSFNSIIEEYLHQIDQQENLVSRPPVVSIMGHIDHGKTTLLDTIRGSQVQKEEKGGITQKISIYQVIFQGKKITFCDTPGHSDFIKMRQRGISLTDLVVLIIDAKSGIMTQTKEIINYLHEYQLPVIVFFNHKRPAETDNEVNLIKLKSQLQGQGLTPMEIISGSARKKEDVNQLCENILLTNEIYQWKANLQLPACGLVVDSKLSSKLGKIALLLVQNGTLREKDLLLTNGKIGKIKRMTDFQKKILNQAFPGDPVQVIGLDFLAEVGEKFLTISDDKVGKKISKLLSDYQKERSEIDFSNQPTIWLNPEIEKQKVINLLVIADTQAALEVLTDLVENKTINDLSFQIIASSVSNIPDQLINLAKITRSYLLIFNLKLSKETHQRFKENQLRWFQSDIIYEVEEKLEKLIQRTKEKKQVEKILGTAEVIKIIYFSKIGNIAGCKVIDEKIERNSLVHVFRKSQKIFSGKIKSLQVEKEKASEAKKGQECGIVLEGFDDFQEKDQIISYCWEEEDVS